MRRVVRAGVIVCLLSIGAQAAAQTVPAGSDAWPEAVPPTRPAPPTVSAPEPQSAPAPEPEPQPVGEPPHYVPPPPGPTGSVHEHWYGWQTLTVDGAALLLLVVGGLAADGPGNAGEELAILAMGTYALGGPIVHFAHANGLQGLGSLGLRVVTPVVFGLVGYAVEDCSGGGEFCGLGGLVLGGALGIITAIVVDAAVLAREEVPDRESVLSHLHLALDREHAGVIASGSF